MQAAIVTMADPASAAGNRELAHALAIAAALPEIGLAPHVLAPVGFSTGVMPVLTLANPGSLTALFKLWRWQRRFHKLLILSIGSGSDRIAKRLYRMSRKRSVGLIQAHLITAPSSCDNIERSALCICGSEAIAAAIRSCPNPPPCAIAQPGLDLGCYNKGTQWQEGERFIFGMAGSLLPESGALLVIRAMAALWQHDLPDWEVRMFGSGPRFDEIMTEAEKMGVRSRLGIFGDQPLGYVTGQCHVWLAPGASPTELPDVLWSGIAANIPVICARSPLHDERLFGSAATLTVCPGNPQELARAMLMLMQSGDARKLRMAEQDILPLISLPVMAKRVSRIIGEYLARISQTER